MKKKLIWILVLTLAVVMTVVGTVAYFSATDAVKNAVAVGNASIELVEFERENVNDDNTDKFVPFKEENKLLLPSIVSDGFDYKTLAGTVNWKDENGGEMNVGGNKSYTSSIWAPDTINNELDKMVFVRNTGNTEVYVRVCFAFEAGNYVWKSHFDRMVHLNKNETDWTWNWGDEKVVEINGTRYFIAWATYKKTLPGQQYTEISLSQIALDSSAISDHAKAFGDKYDVLVFAQGIQVEGMGDDAAAALNKGFTDAYPFGDVKEVNFVDLYTALHYLDGDTNKTVFGYKDHQNQLLNSVTFGLTKDHSAKVAGCEGVLVANREADSSDYTAYAYYVPTADGTQYDIYVLADDWEIYTSNDSDWLLAENGSLKKVDTANLNVSETRNMFAMFNRCYALETIDVSDWDVSNVTDTEYLFNSCNALKSIDVENWDVSKVTKMNYMFSGCKLLTTIGVEDWDVSKVTDMGQMFNGCGGLTELDLNSWNTGNLKKMQSIFNGCGGLTTLNISKWDVSEVTSMSQAFYSCKSLTSLDISGWNVSSVTEMTSMFYACENLIEVNLSNWTTANVTNMFKMFDGCHNLASLDLSRWDTGEVTTMQQMFGSCKALSSLKLPENVSKVTTMESMFYQCRALTELDLSAWNTNLVTKMGGMFNMGEEKGALAKIYVGDGWTVANVASSADMFKNCTALEGAIPYNPAKIDKTHANTDGYLTYKQYTPTNTTP